MESLDRQPCCWKEIGVYGSRDCPRLAEVIHCRSCVVYHQAGRELFDQAPSEDGIDRWTEQLAAVPADDLVERTSLVIFQLGTEWFALTANWVHEGTQIGPWRRIPHRSGNEFLGLMSVRGELLPYFSLAATLGLEGDQGGGHVLVCGGEGRRLTFAVRSILGARRLAVSAENRPPPTVGRAADAYTWRLAEADVGPVAVLDAERLFGAMESRLR